MTQLYPTNTYGRSREKITEEEFTKSFTAGALGGFLSNVLMYPTDIVRTRIMSDSVPGKYKSSFDCLNKVRFYEGGVRAWYRGLFSSTFGAMQYRGLYFGLYSAAKTYLYLDGPLPAPWELLAVAYTTTLTAQILTYPIETVSRRLMVVGEWDVTEKGGRLVGFKPRESYYPSGVQCANKMLEEEGWRSLYRGFGVNSIRAIGAALCIVLFEELRHNSLYDSTR
eukprot:TRINITY_DN4771_c0_g1_i3.p1 TRINITY_DN4771_c0_g1~~TRINITY_DN4771_c0_g1_i3.p1  ORF type:complete len:224 (-),score=30.65 TRINITY_DN4771_c0_g1_i3:59-730(-)